MCEEFIELSRVTATHTDVFDLEPGHSPDAPKLRRVKNPGLNHPVFQRMVHHAVICDVVEHRAVYANPGGQLEGRPAPLTCRRFYSIPHSSPN